MFHIMHEYTETDPATQGIVAIDEINDSKLHIMCITTVV